MREFCTDTGSKCTAFQSFLSCAIPCAAGKREKETQFSFSLLILSSFLAAVRRFLKESCTDMPLLLAYGLVDVRGSAVCCQFVSLKRFHAPQRREVQLLTPNCRISPIFYLFHASLFSSVFPRFSACFIQQHGLVNAHAAVGGFAHIIDGQRRNGCGG